MKRNEAMTIRPLIAIALAALALGTTSCSKDTGPTKPEPAAEQPKPGGHAPANVKPGSYEDWCEEHQVPESQCTRCNKDLIPAFKATSDWCEEHGVPESQCTKCNPSLKIVRPPKPAGG
jgi:hypothetical protein